MQREAGHLDEQQEKQIQERSHLPIPEFVALDDGSMYADTGTETGETVVFADGICVKAQKPTREKADEPHQAKTDKRHETDVMLLPRRDGSFAFVSEGVSGSWSIVEAARAFGSGRMEKAVDQVVGLRQKDHGMSWTRKGSRALALLKVHELNARPQSA